MFVASLACTWACSSPAKDTAQPQVTSTACTRAANVLGQAQSARTDGYLGLALRDATAAHALCPNDVSRTAIDELRTELWLVPGFERAFQDDHADEERRDQARLLYKAGIILRNRDRDYALSLQRLDESYSLWPQVLTIVQMGLTHEAAGDLVEFRKANARALAIAEALTNKPARYVRADGHEGLVRALAYYDDDKALASAGDDGTIRLWDLTSGRVLRTLDAHTEAITAMAINRARTRLLSASADGTAKLWDLQSPDADATTFAIDPSGGVVAFDDAGERFAIETPTAIEVRRVADGGLVASRATTGVGAVAFSPDGTMLALARSHGSVELWDIASDDVLSTADATALGALHALVYSPDGSLLAAAGAGVRVWDVESGEERTDLALDEHQPGGLLEVDADELVVRPAGPARFHGVAFHPDSTYLVGMSELGEVTVRDTASGEATRFAAPLPDAASVAYSARGDHVAFGGYGTIELIDASTGSSWRALGALAAWADHVAVGFDGTVMSTADHDTDTVAVWHLAAGRMVANIPANFVSNPPLLSDDHSVMVSSLYEEVIAWNARDGAVLAMSEGGVDRLAIQPRTNRIALEVASQLSLWSLDTDDIVLIPYGTVQKAADLSAFALSVDGVHAALGRETGAVELWDTNTGELAHTLSGHRSRVTAIAYSPDGSHVASASEQGMIIIQAIDGSPSVLADHIGAHHIALSPDNTVAASADQGSIRLWDATTGERLLDLEAINGVDTLCAFSPDSRRLFVYGDQFTASLYDVSTGSLLKRVDDGADISEDGRIFATAEGALHVYRVDTAAKAATVLHTTDHAMMVLAPDGRLDGELGSKGAGTLIFWQVGDIQLPGFVGLQRERNPGLFDELVGGS
jgi:WD40 repeat protein